MSATQQEHPHAGDDAELAEHGYRQRLNRSLGGFSSFAAGFSYISILTGMFQLFGFGFTVRRTIFSAYLPAAVAGERDFEVEVMNQRFAATRHDLPLYDPKGARVRC